MPSSSLSFISLSSLLLLITTITTITTTVTVTVTTATATATLNFKQAPKFYNSPTCPKPNDNTSPDHLTHIAMTLDAPYLRGSMAAILSVLQHSTCPENLRFHFITTNNIHVSTSSSNNIHVTISTSFPYLHFTTHTFDDSAVAGLISTSIRSALDCPLNYARNYLADLLPTRVEKVVYLDSDLVLVDDIAKLAATPFGDDNDDETVLAAPEYCNADFTSYFTPTFWSNPSLSVVFSDRKACYFNTGVMVIDLVKWRKGDYTTKIIEWMELQKRLRIYELGSLPPFLLVFAGKIAPVDHRWNQHGLGGDNYEGLCRDLHPGPVSLLHWSGKGKPWVRLDGGRACPLDALWAPYDLLQSSRVLEP